MAPCPQSPAGPRINNLLRFLIWSLLRLCVFRLSLTLLCTLLCNRVSVFESRFYWRLCLSSLWNGGERHSFGYLRLRGCLKCSGELLLASCDCSGKGFYGNIKPTSNASWCRCGVCSDDQKKHFFKYLWWCGNLQSEFLSLSASLCLLPRMWTSTYSHSHQATVSFPSAFLTTALTSVGDLDQKTTGMLRTAVNRKRHHGNDTVLDNPELVTVHDDKPGGMREFLL